MSVSAISKPDERFVSTRRSQLLCLRTSYTEQIEQLRATLVELTDDGSQLDMVDDAGFGEGGTHDVERERIRALASNARSRIDDIEVALARLETGSYGTCTSCRQSIDPARLEALPDATLCVGCKSGVALRR